MVLAESAKQAWWPYRPEGGNVSDRNPYGTRPACGARLAEGQ